MEECGHGRWLEGDSYKLDYFLGKNQKKKREREKKKKQKQHYAKKKTKQTNTKPTLPGWEKETSTKKRED